MSSQLQFRYFNDIGIYIKILNILCKLHKLEIPWSVLGSTDDEQNFEQRNIKQFEYFSQFVSRQYRYGGIITKFYGCLEEEEKLRFSKHISINEMASAKRIDLFLFLWLIQWQRHHRDRDSYFREYLNIYLYMLYICINSEDYSFQECAFRAVLFLNAAAIE